MAEHHRSYYAIIPANVRYDKDLTPNAKLLYGEITALCNERGYCWASNKYFAELYGVSKTSISTWINQLIKKGYIYSEVQYKPGSKEIDSRHLTLAPPIKENFNTPTNNLEGGMQENFNTPIQENFKDNNTSFNNTSNKDDEDKDTIRFFQKNIRFNLNPIEVETIGYWEKDYPHELIIEAIKRTAMNGATTVRYTETILKNWQRERLSTVAEVERYEANQQQKGGKRNGSSTGSNATSNGRTEEEMEILAKLKNYNSADYR